MLEFNAERHEYRWCGAVVPGVTGLLDSLHSFAGVDHDVLEAAKHRGSDVHTMTHYYDEGDLDEDQLRREQPDILAYLPAWQAFIRDCRPNWRFIEAPVFHKQLRYAGTPDRFGELHYKGKLVPHAQVDIKTSIASHPVWGIQTAAYNAAAGCPTARRFTAQLRNDGTYRLLEWTSPDDWPAFVSLLTLKTWKMRNNL